MKWNRKALPWVLLAVMTIFTLFLLSQRQKRENNSLPEKTRTNQERKGSADPGSSDRRVRNTDPQSPASREGQLNRHPQQVNYSKHARCRMGCRHIDGDEINEILQNGELNVHKSDMRGQPDPRYAVEGTTRDGQKIRVIVAQGARTSTIVTVIDLDTDWDCDCPGDERKKR
jgi:hypothetical protein